MVLSRESGSSFCSATVGRSGHESSGRYKHSGAAVENPALAVRSHCIGVREPAIVERSEAATFHIGEVVNESHAYLVAVIYGGN